MRTLYGASTPHCHTDGIEVLEANTNLPANPEHSTRYCQEHGRLYPGDVVHHWHGNTIDDRLVNLIALPRQGRRCGLSRPMTRPRSGRNPARRL